jgi:hypothetical protein
VNTWKYHRAKLVAISWHWAWERLGPGAAEGAEREAGQLAREELLASSQHITDMEDSARRSGCRLDASTRFTRREGPNPSLGQKPEMDNRFEAAPG